MPMFEVLDHSCNAFAYYHVGACHLKNYFCYHLPTRGRAGVKLRDADTSQNVSIIFYAPCLFYTNSYMFYVHFISYYDIYWTNLLTRCHSASFCLLCMFIAEKVKK